MRLGVKYCGGCNPRHDRKEIIKRLKEVHPHIKISSAKEEHDITLVISGCNVSCTDHGDYQGEHGKVIIKNSEDYKDIEDLILKLQNRGGLKLNWRNEYKDKIVSAEEAVQKIKSGQRVVCGHAVGEPSYLLDAMVANKENYKDVEIVHMVPMGKAEYTKEEMKEHFRHNAVFVGGSTRKAVENGLADYTPCFFYQVPALLKELSVDVSLIQVSTPDEHGYCSFGVSNDYTKPSSKLADVVIAEINSEMPRTHGDNFIHLSEIDFIVENNHDLIELKPGNIGEIERQIGSHCASLIEDGSTLQLGIGTIPDAVLMFLTDKKDLGIHSEMISDGVVDLVNAGVITNKMKTLHPGKTVVTFLMGTKKLYDFVNDNPAVEMYPVDYVNNPTTIMKNHKMVSINSCVQVDLLGQVVSDSVGLKQISGVGGQVDFVRGASMAENGKSIIAMPSTAAKGKVSKIVPFIDEGAAITTSRNDVDYIVTEFGVARLKGKTLRDRAKALIEIAHPNFKESLVAEYESRFKLKY